MPKDGISFLSLCPPSPGVLFLFPKATGNIFFSFFFCFPLWPLPSGLSSTSQTSQQDEVLLNTKKAQRGGRVPWKAPQPASEGAANPPLHQRPAPGSLAVRAVPCGAQGSRWLVAKELQKGPEATLGRQLPSRHWETWLEGVGSK